MVLKDPKIVIEMKGIGDQYSFIGKRVPKIDSIYMATGEAKYLDDIKLPGMLYAKVLRSPHPHAKILNIDTNKAMKYPGVKAVITAEDTTKVKFCHLPVTPNKMVLADEKVRFIGDEVAAVAAIDEVTAEEVLDLIEVEYEILPAVFDPEKAMESGAPKIYEDCENNIASTFVREFGDIGKGFNEADLIFEDRFTCPPVVSCTIEPHGCIASFDISNRLTVWTTTQNPYNIQRALAGVLKIPVNNIRIVNAYVGGAFGNKSVILPLEPIAAFLAKKTNRPVKLVNNRQEEFISTRTRYSMIIYLKTGVKKDGFLTSREAKVITNNGAYNNKATGITLLTCNRIGNLYRVPNVRTKAFIVYTNNQYGDALRGWGGPQAHFAVESQMDIIAEALNMDPLELRLKNANQSGDTTPWGWKISSCGLTECLKEVARISKWDHKRKQSGPKGIGMASVIHTGGGSMGTHGGGNYSEVFMKLNSDGTVNVVTGDSDIGQGSDTILTQIVAEELGISMDNIKITSRDTDVTPVTMGTWGSRVTFIGGNAAKSAASEMKRKLFEVAAEMLEVEPHNLEAKGGLIYVKGEPDKYLSISEVAYSSIVKKGETITSKVTYSPKNTSPPDPKTGYGNYCPTYSFGVHVAEVEVDEETGKIMVTNIFAAHDVGRAINPLLIEGQIEGGIAMGIGYALLEKLQWESGKTLNPNFCTYKIINSTEIPKIQTLLIETIDPDGPFGAKGVGEPATIPTAPAVANAIYNAIRVRVKDLPITPDKILKALKEKQKGELIGKK
jgi:4-hydroxybenzoyl-CoA reductase alpha subunit